jgi:TolB-like protein
VLLLASLLAAPLAPAPAFGGQVVTAETKAWAAEALRQEKTAGTPAGKNSVAVLNFANRTGQASNDPLRKGIPLMLITDLSTVPGLDVVERVRFQALAEEMKLGASGLVESGTEPRIGKLLGARWIVGGDLSGSASELKADARVLDVPKDNVTGQPSATGNVDDLFTIEKSLLFGLLKELKVEVTPEQEKKLRKPCSTKAGALLSLFKAVDESDRGNYAKANEQYEKALKEDPGICIAGEAVAELKALGLLAPKPAPARKKSVDALETLKGETSVTDQLAPKEQLRTVVPPKDTGTPANLNVIFP